MPDQYHINLENLSLEAFKHNLATGELLPGRLILKEDLPHRFQVLDSMGIRNIQDLASALKTKKRMESFAQESGLPLEYLVILRREVNSYLPNPVRLSAFPEVDSNSVERLASAGIKHSKHLFARAQTRAARDELAEQVDVPLAALLEMVKLSDLVRVSGVGPVFARLLYDSGTDTLEKLAQAVPEDLHKRLTALNREKGITQVAIPVRDIDHCIQVATELPLAIEY